MLFLIFQLGKDSYAIDVHRVNEILPLVRSTPVPRAPVGFAGLFSYHGTIVPLIDLTELALGRPSEMKMSTRIIVTDYLDESGKRHQMGVIVEQAMETLRRDKSDLVDSGMSVENSLYLGSVTTDDGKIIQHVDIDRLLPTNLRDQLFREVAGSKP